jgi:thioredoxin reductase
MVSSAALGARSSPSSRSTISSLFLFLGAAPCTDWLGDVVARDDNGFILTRADAGSHALLETSVPGIYPAGDVRSGSVKRCASSPGIRGSARGSAHVIAGDEPLALRAERLAKPPAPA